MKKIIIFLFAILSFNLCVAFADIETSENPTNIGIGTNSTENALSIRGTMALGSSTYTSRTAPANGLIVEGNVGIGTFETTYKLDVDGPARLGGNGNLAFTNSIILNAAVSNILAITGGNVGINSTNPGKTLDVLGTGRFSSSLSASSLTATGLTAGQCVQTSTGGLFTTTGSACGSGGSITIGTTSPMTGAGTGSSFTLGVDETKLTLSNLGGAVTDAQVPNNITITNLSGTNTGDQTTISGNAGTATALAANGTNCSAGNYPLGVDASGNVEDCTLASGGSIGIGTANTITFWPTTTTIGSLPTATYPSLTELSYVKGATSSLQSQIDGLGVGVGGWTDGGTNVYTSLTTDNVAIGTTTPTTKLTVAGTVSATAFTGDGSALTGIASGGWSDGGTNVYPTATTDNVGIGTTTPSTTLEIVKQGSQIPLMVSATATGDGNYLIINSAGNIGISTVNPGVSLHVNGGLWLGSGAGSSTLKVSNSNGMAYAYNGNYETVNRTFHNFSTTGHGGEAGNQTTGLKSTTSSYQTGSGSFVRAIHGEATTVHPAGTTDNVYGVYGNTIRNASGGTVTNAWSIYGAGNTETTGTTTRAYAGGFAGRVGVGGNIGIGSTITSSYVTTTPPTGGMIVEGNTGIGTALPQDKFQVLGDSRIGNGTFSNTSANEDLYVEGNLEVDGTLYIGSCSGAGCGAGGASGWTDGGTNVYTTATTDTVGIGTTTPSTTLEIVKQGSSAPLMVSSTATGDGDVLIITSAGRVGIGTLLPRGLLDLGPTGTIYTQTITGPTGPTILGTSNNVGIGTITAGSLLAIGTTGQATVSSAGAIATSSTVSVADDAYAAGWNGSTAVPTKNAVYDKIETIGASSWTDSGAFLYATTTTDNVGIGTVAPDQRLKVEGSSATNISTMVRNSNSSGVASVKVWNSSNLGFEMVATGSGYAVPNTYGVLATAGESLSFGESDGTINMRINPAGTVRFTPTDTPDTCNAGNEGSLYYDNSLNEFCDCDGSSWAQVDGGGAC